MSYQDWSSTGPRRFCHHVLARLMRPFRNGATARPRMICAMSRKRFTAARLACQQQHDDEHRELVGEIAPQPPVLQATERLGATDQKMDGRLIEVALVDRAHPLLIPDGGDE